MNSTTLEVIKAFAPVLAERSEESLERTRLAYTKELKRFQDSDEFERDHLMNMKSGMGAFSEAIKKKYGTVWTDQRVVDLTVNEALKYFKGDLDTATFCDPSCGDGNFLITFYNKLVERQKIADPVERSLDALRRIYGVDIIDRMAAAARIRLLVEHIKHLKRAGVVPFKDSIPAATAIIGCNIIHGNTLRTEADTWELEAMEGGLTPNWFRELKFGVVCGNPPYTRYADNRGKDLPVPAKYRQPNMAASFWQWAAESVADEGIYGLNVTNTILNSDAAARREYSHQVMSIIHNELTKTYSRNFGGDMPTLVFVGATSHNGQLIYNGKPLGDKALLRKGRFLSAADYQCPAYVPLSVNSYVPELFASVGGGNDIEWNNTLGINGDASDNYVAFGRRICGTRGRHEQFKLLKTDNPLRFISSCKIGTAGRGEVRYFKAASREQALLLWCFLNSSTHLSGELPKYGKQLQGTGRKEKIRDYEINAVDFFLLQVPDIEHYKAIRSAEFQAVLDFAEAHTKSNDVQSYCAGVDTVINNLLGINGQSI